MESTDSPQLRAVGEDLQNSSEKRLVSGIKPSYAGLLVGKLSAETETKLELSPVLVQNGTPTVEFTVDEVNSFTREEGLHQAVIIKFSYGKPAIHELRQMLPRLFDVKGKCNIGQLEHRHILVRFDLFEDFVKVVSRTSGYVRYKGDDFFFRTFLWTMGFNPREETSKAVVWISFPDLPANLFARKSLMSIASAVGKPLAVDKATNERTRPSTARVKVLVNLIDKHPKKVKIKVVNMNSGNLVEYDQKIVFDNLPKYCTYCLHQGHEKKLCRWISEDHNDKTVTSNVSESKGSMPNSGRNAREILNEIKAERRGEVIQLSGNKDVAKKNADDATDKIAESVQFHKDSYPVNVQQNSTALSELPLAVTPAVIQQNSTDEGISIQQNAGLINCDQLVYAYAESTEVLIDHIPGQNSVASIEQVPGTGVKSADELALPNGMSISNAYVDSLDKTGSKLTAEVNPIQSAERLTPANFCVVSVPTGSSQGSLQANPKIQPNVSAQSKKKEYVANDISERSANRQQKSCVLPSRKQSKIPSADAKSSTQKGRQAKDLDDGVLDKHNPVRSNADDMDTVDQNSYISRINVNEVDPTVLEMTVAANEICPTINDASDSAKQIKNTVSLKSISMMDYQLPVANSTHEIGSVSGVKNPFAQQNIELDKLVAVTDVKGISRKRAIKVNDDTAQSCKSVNLLASKVNSPSEIPIVAEISPIVTEVVASNEDTHHNAIHATNHSDIPVQLQNTKDGQLKDIEGMQQNNNMQNQGSGNAQSGNLISNWISAERIEQDLPKDMVVKVGMPVNEASQQQKGNSPVSGLKQSKQIAEENTALIPRSKSLGMVVGGKLQVVKSYPPVPYTYIESNDHEDISIVNEENKKLVLANMREMVIKSKLWDQRQFSDEDSWDEGSTGFSSAEEDQEDGYDSSREELESQRKSAIVLWNAKNPSAASSSRLLNHNAVAYIPNSNSFTGGNKYESSAIQISSDKRHLQNDMDITFEEGEEEEMLMQCLKDAARKGDLSPMHSKTNKKIRQRDRSWDGRVIEEASIRRPPMRVAKQKQLAQRTNKKA